MESQDGGHEDSKLCSDVAAKASVPTESSPVSVITPEDTEGPCDSSNSVVADVREMSTSQVEPVLSLAEAASNSPSTDNTISQEADTLQEVSCLAESGSPHRADVNTPTEDIASVESGICESGESEGGSESSPVHETPSDAAVDNDDDWIYVLGHDQLKKLACIIFLSSSVIS